MRVLAQRNVTAALDGVDIYFVDDDPVARRSRVAHFEPQENGVAQLVWKDRAEGERVEPTLRLMARDVDDLRRALDEYGPATADNITFVRDAISVRDRLLTLVERLTVRDG